jgi:hypothetical protein
MAIEHKRLIPECPLPVATPPSYAQADTFRL